MQFRCLGRLDYAYDEDCSIRKVMYYINIFRSMILSRRSNDDDSRDGFTKWPFMTTHTWGEYPQGTWTLEVGLK